MKHWIQAARLRTLPLSISGIIIGGFLAKSKDFFSWRIFIFSLLTTILYQILSNFANDYGDGIKGTDNYKLGEQRTVQSGLITARQMKMAVILLTILSFISSILLLYFSFFPENSKEFFLFLGFGIASILAAIFYTIGKNAYGYAGFGDIFVFLFFGLLAVLGSEYLYTKTFDWHSILPASAIGFFSVAVLNLNNMRDMETDKRSGKNTFALKLGLFNAKIYQLILMYLPFAFTLIYVLQKFPNNYKSLIFLVLFIPLTALRRRILEVKNVEEFDPMLKQVALTTLLFSILFGLGITYFV